MDARQLETYRQMAQNLAVPWREDIKWQKILVIEAESFNSWVYSVLPQVKDFVPGFWHEKSMTKVNIGKKLFALRKLPFTARRYAGPIGLPPFLRTEADYHEGRTSLDTYQPSGKHGIVMFTDVVVIPVLVGPTSNGVDVLMSLTPNEIITLRPGLRHARGNVLIGGMGLGWFARRVLERRTVKHVTVVDIDNDVLQYFGATLKESFGDKLTLVHGNAYEQAFGDYDSLLFDIWDTVNSMPYDRKWAAIAERHPNAWGWGFTIPERR